MNQYESLIDPADFGTIADYLRSPQSSIDHLLHVKAEVMLPTLAEELDREAQRERFPRWLLSDVVARHLDEGSVLISSRREIVLSNLTCVIEPASIPRHALCHVIYRPPFYLVHTPGLFEGMLIRTKTENTPGHRLHSKRGPRMKM
jgi:hypothetical protein